MLRNEAASARTALSSYPNGNFILKENIGYGVDKYNNVKNEIYKVRVVIKFVKNEMKIVTSLPEYK